MGAPSAISALREKRDLSSESAESLMRHMVGGDAEHEWLKETLLLLNEKGVTGTELAAFVRVVREQAVVLEHSYPTLVDTCGTGGGRPTFNLSTGAAIVAAAAGAKVAKHGNRAVTSKCGSADVLEGLGINLSSDAGLLSRMLDTAGIVFLFAPLHHPTLRNVAAARKELSVRTVFNVIGPLANPAGASRQLIGVYDPALLDPVAEALQELGVERALVVHGREGLDEVSPCSETDYRYVYDGMIEVGVFKPPAIPVAALAAGDSIQENCTILCASLQSNGGSRSEALVPNAGAALWLSGISASFQGGLELATDTISNGAAARKLDELIEASNA